MPKTFPLRLGSLWKVPIPVQRSTIRWLREHGQPFRKGDVLGYCNIAIGGPTLGQGDLFRFDAERWDLQVAFVATVPGRLFHVDNQLEGGWHDRQEILRWNPAAIVAEVETAAEPADQAAESLIRYHFVTGRRATELAEDRSGLLTGWHDRARAWRAGGEGPTGSVMGLGTCELLNVLRGEQGAFVEMLEDVTGPAQIIDVPDRPLVHNARIILEQMDRTAEDRRELANEFRSAVLTSPPGNETADWTFTAMSLQALLRSPAEERFDLLTPAGVRTTDPADAIVLSINAETPTRLRHRRLGFHFDCHSFQLRLISSGLRSWFQERFEHIEHTLDDIKRDYLELARRLRQSRPQRQILVLNAMSTTVGEDILSYDSFDQPLGRSLQSVRARELNALLHDLADEADIAIVDADAIGAELGAVTAIPDGIHQNGEMQTELRREILSILRSRGVPGFALPPVTESRTTPATAANLQPLQAAARPLNR